MLTLEQYQSGMREDLGVRYYQTMPPLKSDEYDELKADIRENGITVPVIVDEHDNVIDGHHRSMIARELGVECPKRTVEGLSESEKLAMSVSLNIKRRQLSRGEKRQIIAAQLKTAPERSNREHAKVLGVSHHTVNSVRDDLETRGQIAHVEERQDSLGRMQPASRPVERVTETVKVETTRPIEEPVTVDMQTGEITDAPAVPEPRPTMPKHDSDYWDQQNAEQGAQALGRSLQTLKQFRHEQKRNLFLTKWLPRGLDAVPPGAKELINPDDMQLIAGYLTQLAKDMENKE